MSGADFSPNTPSEEMEMLHAIGIDSVQNLFDPIPEDLRAGVIDLSEGVSEFELMRRMESLAGKNGSGIVNFVGAGYYDHLIPSVVDHLAGRAEFFTSYTPYQPECSQGTLQALYEYQTVMCTLTGMDVSNASLYDGGTALAEAALMALRITGRKKILVDGGVNPIHRKVVSTYLSNLPVELVEIHPRQGVADRPALTAALDDATAAVVLQHPNFFGSVDDYGDLAEKAHGCGALLIASVYPISLGILKSPGEMGADIVVGDGQSLGNPLSFGGPSFGFITTRKEYVRNIPGRLVGETVDKEGRRGFVLTLQTREQHIKRHRATSNICSNQSLCALRASMFLCSLGGEGFKELARLNFAKGEYAKRLLGEIKGVAVLNQGATFNEFTLALPAGAEGIAEKLLASGIAAGIPLGRYYPELERCLVVTVTEKRTRDEIDLLVRRLEGALWS